jgi:hypothetical protein
MPTIARTSASAAKAPSTSIVKRRSATARATFVRIGWMTTGTSGSTAATARRSAGITCPGSSRVRTA